MCSPAALPTVLKIPVTWGQRGAAGRSTERHLKWNCECCVWSHPSSSKVQLRGCRDSRVVHLPRCRCAAISCHGEVWSDTRKTCFSDPPRHATDSATSLVLWYLQRTKILCAATPRSLLAQMRSARRVRRRMGVDALSTSDFLFWGRRLGVCFKIKWLGPLLVGEIRLG